MKNARPNLQKGNLEYNRRKCITGNVHNDFLRNVLRQSLQGVDMHIRIR